MQRLVVGALVAAGLACTPARADEASIYFAQYEGTLVCPSLEAWKAATSTIENVAPGCRRVARDTKFLWDGRREASVGIMQPAAWADLDGHAIVVNPNLLGRLQYQDPDITDIQIGPKGSILCENPDDFAEAATALGDERWFAETSCLLAPAGTPAKRIDPQWPVEASFWKVRYMPAGAPHKTLYGSNGDFVLRSGERIRYTPRR